MIDVIRHTLPSGLTVLLVPTPSLHTAEVGFYTRAGPRFETSADNGVSHLLEHTLFRGSHAFSDALAMHQAIEACGGPLFGSTARDNSLYSMAVAPRHLPRAIELLGLILLQPTFAELDLERELILEERLQERDAEGTEVDLDNLSRRKVWPGHPIGMPILGPESNIRRFRLAHVQAHYQRTFAGANCLAYVAGPMDPQRVLDSISEAFSPLPRGPARQSPPVDGTGRDGFRPVVVRHDGSQDDLLLSFRCPSATDARVVTLQMLSGILGDGVASRLQWRVCERLGLAYTIESGLDLYHDTGVLDIEASVGPGKVHKVLQEVVDVLHRLMEEGPDEAELARARERHRLGVEFSLDSPGQLGSYYGGCELYAAAPPLEERLAQADAVDAGAVRDLAQALFHASNLVLTVVGQVSPSLRTRLEATARRLGATWSVDPATYGDR